MNLNKNAKLIYLHHYYNYNDVKEIQLKELLSSNKFKTDIFPFQLSEENFSRKDANNEFIYHHIIEQYLDKKIKENFKPEDENLFSDVVKLGFNINQIFEDDIFYGASALFNHLKTKPYSPTYINFLIKNNFDINAQDSSGKTLLLHAILNKSHPILVKILMMFGSNPYIKDDANLDVFDYVKMYQVENIYNNALSFTEDYNYNFLNESNQDEYILMMQDNVNSIHMSFSIQNLFDSKEKFDEYMNYVYKQDKINQELLLKNYLLIDSILDERKEISSIFIKAKAFIQTQDCNSFIDLAFENLNSLLSYHDPDIDNFIIKENIIKKLSQLPNAKEVLNKKDKNGSSPLFKAISSKNEDLINVFFELNSFNIIDLNQKTPNGATIAKKLLYTLNEKALKIFEDIPQLIATTDNDGTNLIGHVMKKSKYNIAKRLLSINPDAYHNKDDYGLSASDYISVIANNYFWTDGWQDVNSEFDLDLNVFKNTLKSDFETTYLLNVTENKDMLKRKKIKL